MAEAARTEEPAVTGESRAANLLDIDDVLGEAHRSDAAARQYNGPGRERCGGAGSDEPFCTGPPRLMYLPPTISPCDSSKLPGMLEHPTEVFTYYRNNGVSSVICEEKHMGSRAIVVVGRDAAAIQRRFGITGEGIGRLLHADGKKVL